VEAFPEFSGRWSKHLADWGGECAGSYNDMAEFAHFVGWTYRSKEQYEEIQRAFLLLE
jgi:hypothetical protein